MNEDLKYLNDNNYFDINSFMAFLEERFPGPMKYPFTRELVMNILNDAALDWNYCDGEFLNRLVNMIPELTWDDVIKFADALMIETR